MADPVAPTVAPSAPTAPPPTERPSSDWMQGTENDFAEMDAGKPVGDKPAEPKGVAPKPAETKPPASTDPKSKDKPDADAPPADQKTADVKPVKAADLRTAYEGMKKKVKDELEPEIQRLRAKVTEFESKKPEDSAPIVAEMTAIKKRNAELERHIAFVDYTKSNDFTTKYSEPYRAAWADAVAEFSELTVRKKDGEDENGNPIFKTRPADETDLLRLANLKLSEMDAEATEMFGPSASRAINHIQNLKKLSAAQAKALEDAKTNAVNMAKQYSEAKQARAQASVTAFKEVNAALESKFPKAFKAEDGNADDIAAHTKGFALADLLFKGNNALTSEQIETLPAAFKDTVKNKKPLSDAQRVQLHALARLKIANHDRKVAALKKASARIAELEKSLAEFEQSEPRAGRAGGGSASPSKSWDEQVADELKALDR